MGKPTDPYRGQEEAVSGERAKPPKNALKINDCKYCGGRGGKSKRKWDDSRVFRTCRVCKGIKSS